MLTVTRMIENFSRVWGGRANILLPVGEDFMVDDRFWPVVTAYDADVFGTYQLSHRGRHMANPSGFEEWLDREAKQLAEGADSSIDDAKAELLDDRLYRQPISHWKPADAVSERIRHWMAPFIGQRAVFNAVFIADSKAMDPVGGVTDLLELELTPSNLVTIRVEGLPDVVQLMVDTRVGVLAPSAREGLIEKGWSVDEIASGPDDLDVLLDLAWRGRADRAGFTIRSALARAGDVTLVEPELLREDLLDVVPFGVGMVGCGLYVPFETSWDSRAIYVVIGDTAEDYCAALALDRGWDAGLWLPQSLVDDASASRERTILALGRTLHTLGRGPGGDRRIELTTLSLDDSAVIAVAEMLQASPWGSELELEVVDPGSLSLPTPQRILDRAHISQLRYEPFAGVEMIGRLNPPLVPGEARSSDPHTSHWLVDARVDNVSVPTRSALADRVRVGNEFQGGKVRPGKDGIVCFSHRRGLIPGGATLDQILDRHHLRVPDAPEIFGILLDRHDLRSELSDKGKYASATIQRFGGLRQALANLSDLRINRILHSYATPHKKPSPGFELATGGGGGRRHFLTLEDMARVANCPLPELAGAVDALVALKILRRGFRLKCGRCDYTGWYELDVVNQGFVCMRCGDDQLISSAALREPELHPHLYYDLDEVVYQAIEHDGAVTLMALGQLIDDGGDFSYAVEMQVSRVAETDPFCEIDIWAVSRGEILIGEAKRGDRLTNGNRTDEQKSADSLARVAEAVSADAIVLATAADSWKSSVLECVEAAISHLPTRLEVLTDVAPARPWE